MHRPPEKKIIYMVQSSQKTFFRLTWLYLSLEPQSAGHFGDQAVSDKEKMLTDLRLRIERLLLFVRSPDILQSWSIREKFISHNSYISK